MLATNIVCPHCSKALKATQSLALGKKVRCKQCGTIFSVTSSDISTNTPLPPTIGTGMTTAVAPMAPVAVLAGSAVGLDDEPITTEPDGGRVLKIGLVALVLVAAVFFIGGSSVLALVYAAYHKRNAVASAKPGNSAPGQPKPSANPGSSPGTPPPTEKKAFRPGVNDPGEVETVSVPRLPPDEQEKVDKAIEKGLEYVKKLPTNFGNGGHWVGVAALQGLTLLECGVKGDDDTVKAVTQYIRGQLPQEFVTYDVSLALLYLDRLGDPADRQLIQTLALRLVAGQLHDGGWTYECHVQLTPAEEKELLAILEQTRPRNPLELFVDDQGKVSPEFVVPRPGETLPEFVVPSKGTDGDGRNEPANAAPKDIRKVLEKASPKLKNLPGLQPPGATQLAFDSSDNSNTQFAILAVWVSARYDIPVERTLALLVKRFRTSQDKQGNWGYHYQRSPMVASVVQPSIAMTCAGLLGLGAGYGLTANPADKAANKPPVQDKMVQTGFKALEKVIDKPLGKGRQRGVGQPFNLYFLWSLERVGVMYNVTNIGDKDWYRWGAELIVEHQQANGKLDQRWLR